MDRKIYDPAHGVAPDDWIADLPRPLARRGDVLVVITTSGNSPSILRAVRAAQDRNIRCIALNGRDGGALSPILNADDIDIVAPGASTARIQEIHGIIIHAFCELIDHQLFGEI